MKKYRTKSGKVEEKLPGVNATVSKSEKAQIAMAGGANTISDVQAILGTPGKKNNLKGQGAKHLMSFQWGDESFGAPGGEEESEPDTPADPGQDGGDGEIGYAGQLDPTPTPPSFDQTYPGDEPRDLKDIGPTYDERAAKVARAGGIEPGASSLRGIDVMAEAAWDAERWQFDPDELDPYAPIALLSPLDKDQRTAVEKSIAKERAEFKEDYDKQQEIGLVETLTDFGKKHHTALSIVSGLENIAKGAKIGGPVGALIGGALSTITYLATKPPDYMETVGDPEGEAYGTTPSLRHGPEPDYETIAYNIQPTPPPPPPGADPINKPKKLKKIPPITDPNKVTLAMGEKGGPTRQQLRRQRGGFRRYA